MDVDGEVREAVEGLLGEVEVKEEETLAQESPPLIHWPQPRRMRLLDTPRPKSEVGVVVMTCPTQAHVNFRNLQPLIRKRKAANDRRYVRIFALRPQSESGSGSEDVEVRARRREPLRFFPDFHFADLIQEAASEGTLLFMTSRRRRVLDENGTEVEESEEEESGSGSEEAESVGRGRRLLREPLAIQPPRTPAWRLRRLEAGRRRRALAAQRKAAQEVARLLSRLENGESLEEEEEEPPTRTSSLFVNESDPLEVQEMWFNSVRNQRTLEQISPVRQAANTNNYPPLFLFSCFKSPRLKGFVFYDFFRFSIFTFCHVFGSPFYDFSRLSRVFTFFTSFHVFHEFSRLSRVFTSSASFPEKVMTSPDEFLGIK
jgi:hypothetical protein